MRNLNGFIDEEQDQPNYNPLTPGTSQQVAPEPMPIQAPIAPPSPMPQQVMTPKQPMAIPPSPKPLPGMPPSVTPDELEGYLNTQKQSLNKFGSEAQMDLQRQTLDDRNSLSNRATSGLKGFADALMMGVAGAGNPGWQQSFDAQQDAQAKEQMDTLKGANAANIQRTEANMSLDKMDPNSTLSKTAQDTFGPLLSQKLGIKNIKNLSAAEMQNVLESSLKYAGIEADEDLKKANLELQTLVANGNLVNQKATRDQADVNARRDAALAISKGSNIPFVGPSHKQKVAATDFLASEAQGIPQFQSEAEAEAAGLPDGTPVVIGGVSGKWSHQ